MPRMYPPLDAVLDREPPLPGWVAPRLTVSPEGFLVTDGTTPMDGPGWYIGYRDPWLDVVHPLMPDGDHRLFFDRDGVPFIGLRRHDPGLVVRALAQGVSPVTEGGTLQGWGVQDSSGRPVPFVEALLRADHWSDPTVRTVLDEVDRQVALPGLKVHGRTLLDVAVQEGRWVLAETLWDQGVRYGAEGLARGDPVWSLWTCPFGQWAVAFGLPGCVTPQAAATVWTGMTPHDGQRLMRQAEPLLHRWLNRALDAGVNLTARRRLSYVERQGEPTKALTTGPVGMVLFQAIRPHLYAPQVRDAWAHDQVEGLLQAGARFDEPLVWSWAASDGCIRTQPPLGFAQAHGLSATAGLLERWTLRTLPLPDGPTVSVERPRL